MNEKKNQPLVFVDAYQKLSTNVAYRFVDFSAAVVLLFGSLSIIPEMHDRIITGVAFARQIPVVTKDQFIVSCGLVKTIW